jgi:hypothetical protein
MKAVEESSSHVGTPGDRVKLAVGLSGKRQESAEGNCERKKRREKRYQSSQ